MSSLEFTWKSYELFLNIKFLDRPIWPRWYSNPSLDLWTGVTQLNKLEDLNEWSASLGTRMAQSNKFENLNGRFASLGIGMTQRYKFRNRWWTLLYIIFPRHLSFQLNWQHCVVMGHRLITSCYEPASLICSKGPV